MESLFARACGLDVHESSIMACVLVGTGRRPKKQIREFSAMAGDIAELRDWLLEEGVEAVVMEGTGVYWRPVYEMLESTLDVWVVNARHVKKVPGRKSDVIDAEWLARLLRNGLLRKSFIPAPEIRQMRDLNRHRRRLVQARTSEKNRILKLIETAGLKLAMVASDVFGVSGRAILEALADGETSAANLARLAKGRLRQKIPQLELALECVVGAHHRRMLREQLDRLAATDLEIERYEQTLDVHVASLETEITLLSTIPGVGRRAAIEILSEVGADLTAFPKASNFCAWAGTAPGLNMSAGKNASGRRRRGNRYLSSILFECAVAATRTKKTYLADKFRRLRARRPVMVAIFAIANKIAAAVHHVLTKHEPYKDLGASYLAKQRAHQNADRLLDRLIELDLPPDNLLNMLRLRLISAPDNPGG